MNTIALIQDSNGEFGIKFENKTFVEESIEMSIAKHNLLCFGRLNKNTTTNPLMRRGSVLSVLNGNEVFSTAWAYYMEGVITTSNITKIINEFNRACDRDLKAGIIEKSIVLKSVTKLDKTTLNFKIEIGGQEQSFTINLN